MANNPNNAIGTNAGYGGRTSANAFNDVLAGFSRGILSGWNCVPNAGLTLSLGGNGTTRDVAVAQDNIGDKITINNISNAPVDITLAAAPGTNTRIDAIVAYVDNPPQGQATVADNPESCGLIDVTGIAAASPVAPNDSAIRTAITADGASGTTAYYVVLAYVTIAAGTTDIDAGMIKRGGVARSRELSFTNHAKITPTLTGATLGNLNAVYYALNEDGTAGKIYGGLRITVTSTTAVVTLPISGLNPPSQFTIARACFFVIVRGSVFHAINSKDIVVNTNGTCTVSFPGELSGDSITLWFPPCIYFFNDFGDGEE